MKYRVLTPAEMEAYKIRSKVGARELFITGQEWDSEEEHSLCNERTLEHVRSGSENALVPECLKYDQCIHQCVAVVRGQDYGTVCRYVFFASYFKFVVTVSGTPVYYRFKDIIPDVLIINLFLAHRILIFFGSIFSSIDFPRVCQAEAGNDMPYSPPGHYNDHTSVVSPDCRVKNRRVEEKYKAKS